MLNETPESLIYSVGATFLVNFYLSFVFLNSLFFNLLIFISAVPV